MTVNEDPERSWLNVLDHDLKYKGSDSVACVASARNGLEVCLIACEGLQCNLKICLGEAFGTAVGIMAPVFVVGMLCMVIFECVKAVFVEGLATFKNLGSVLLQGVFLAEHGLACRTRKLRSIQ